MVRQFYTLEELLFDVEPRYMKGHGGSMETLYSQEDLIKVAKAYAKDMARQVLNEADGGLLQSSAGNVPQPLYHEVLMFINEQ